MIVGSIALVISFGALAISGFTLYLNYLKPPKIIIEHISNIITRDDNKERRYKDYLFVINTGAKKGLIKRIMPIPKNDEIRVGRVEIIVTNEENDWKIDEPDPHAIIPIKSKTSYVVVCDTVCYGKSHSPLDYYLEVTFDKKIEQKNIVNRSHDKIKTRRV